MRRKTCLPVILTERSEWNDLIALSLLQSKKEELKNAHANKNAFAAFSIPLFSKRWLAERKRLVISFCRGERRTQSGGGPAGELKLQIPPLAALGRNDNAAAYSRI